MLPEIHAIILRTGVRMKVRITCSALLLIASLLQAGDNRWTSQGPFGGGLSNLTIHPRVKGLFFASGETTIRTTNAGGLWTSFDLGGGMAIRVNPKNTNEIVAASRDVFRSEDQGRTWKFVSGNKFQGDVLIDFEFDPINPTTLYGVTDDHGVFKSVDGGKTWQPKNAGLDFRHCNGCSDTTRIEIDQTNGNNVFVLLPSRKVYRTRDGGQSWQVASGGLNLPHMVAALAIDPSNPQVLYVGGDDGVFKTTDAGGSWKSTNCNCQATDLAVDSALPQNVYVAYLGVSKSSNGGASWKHINVPPPSFYLASVTARANQILISSYSAGIYRSQNGGTSWVPINNGVNSLNVGHLAASPQRPGLILAEGENFLYRTNNDGSAWQLVKNTASVNFSALQIHPQNPNLVVGASCCCAPLISTNGGTSFQCKTNFDFSSDNLALDPKNQQTIYLISGVQGVAKSTDQGNGWNLANSGLSDIGVLSIAIDPVNTGNLFVGTRSGRIFKTSNGASSWSASGSDFGNAPIIALAIDPQNPNNVYAMTDYHGKGVYKSTNGGQNWTIKSKGLPTGAISLVIDPSNPSKLFAGAYGGAYITTDGAESWSLFDTNGLGPFVVLNFLVDPSNPNVYFAATQRGVFAYKRTVTPGGPSVERINPQAAKPGSLVTISGSNFGSTQGNSKILFGSADAGTAVSWTNNSIQIRVPSKAQTAPLTLSVASINSNAYNFVAPATTGKITPTTGTPTGGTTVTLTVPPTLLTQLTEQLTVLFGGTVASGCYAVPPSNIVCPAPPASDAAGSIQLLVIINSLLLLLGTFSYGG